MTEQTKTNISISLFAMMILVNDDMKEDDKNAGNCNEQS